MWAPFALASSCQPSSTPAHAGELAKKAKPLGKSQGDWLPTLAHAGKMAMKAKPLGTSQGARSGRGKTLLAPASWLLPDLLGFPTIAAAQKIYYFLFTMGATFLNDPA